MHGDGRVRYRFKAAWKDGTHAVLLDPLDFIARTAHSSAVSHAQYGVLAAHSSVRAEVVPGREPLSLPVQLPLFATSDASPLGPPPPARHPWDWLLKRGVVDFATAPADIARVLAHQARAPPPPRPSRPARSGQFSLAFG